MDDMTQVLIEGISFGEAHPPRRVHDLLPLAGWDYEAVAAPKAWADTSWPQIIKQLPLAARKWLVSPTAFIPPARWPDVLGNYFYRSLAGRYVPTPYDWALDFCPQPWSLFGRPMPQRKNPARFVYEYPDVGLISLAAHGYPLSYEEQERAINAYRFVLGAPNFLVWWLNVDIGNMLSPTAQPLLAKQSNYTPLSFTANACSKLFPLNPIHELWNMEPRPQWLPRSIRQHCMAVEVPFEYNTAKERKKTYVREVGVLPDQVCRLQDYLKAEVKDGA